MAERLYYADSFLTAFESRVSDIREVSRAGGESLWKIALERSAFYPTSGGQPYDTGTLYATSRSGATLEVPIESVEEDEQGEVWHYTLKPMATGTKVRASVDWDRRLDHMQQHSAQHLLSAVFSHELHAHTVSFHLGDESSTIDLAVESLAQISIERVEHLANALIAEDRAITARTVSRTEADSLLAAGQLRKLPEREGTIRLVEIASYDLNACGGTHLRSTGQIGGILLRSIERVRHAVRVEFVAGLRGVNTARRDFSVLTKSAGTLSIARSDVPEAVDRLLADAKAGAKERLRLRQELAAYQATQLVVEELIEDHLRVIRREYSERDPDYVKMLASQVTAAAPQTVVILASTQQDPAFVVMARSRGLDVACGALMKDALAGLGLRGGGSQDLAQGQVPRTSLGSLMSLLEAEARAVQQKS